MSIWMKTTDVIYADLTAAAVCKGPWLSWASTLASDVNEFKTKGR